MRPIIHNWMKSVEKHPAIPGYLGYISTDIWVFTLYSDVNVHLSQNWLKNGASFDALIILYKYIRLK